MKMNANFSFLTYLTVPISSLFWHCVASLSPIKSQQKMFFIPEPLTSDKAKIRRDNEKLCDEKFLSSRSWELKKDETERNELTKRNSIFMAQKRKKVIKWNLKSSFFQRIKSKCFPIRSAVQMRREEKEIIIEMETRGNIHLNKKFIKNIYLYGAIKAKIEYFLGKKGRRDAIQIFFEFF